MKIKDSASLVRSAILSLITVALASALGGNSFAAEAGKQQAPDLTGGIASKDGQPIANASIFIYTAGPRVGFSPI